MACFSYSSDDAARPDVRPMKPAISFVDVPFPSVPDKHGYPSAYRPAAFLEALRAAGWEPGPVPESVVFTYARFELYLTAHPEAYTPNHMLGPGPGRFEMGLHRCQRQTGDHATVRPRRPVFRRGTSGCGDGRQTRLCEEGRPARRKREPAGRIGARPSRNRRKWTVPQCRSRPPGTVRLTDSGRATPQRPSVTA